MRKDRIEERLAALKINQFDAAKRAGKNSHFIYDFLIGRKQSFKGDGPIKLAEALECSIEYLTGASDDIGRPPATGEDQPESSNGDFGLPFAGVVEAGSFRKASSLRFPDDVVPILPNPKYPAEMQMAFLVRGDGLAARGIREGAFLTVVDEKAASRDVKNGSLVVVEHSRHDGAEVEISARELQYFPGRTELSALSETEVIEPIIVTDGKTSDNGRLRIIGLVVAATVLL